MIVFVGCKMVYKSEMIIFILLVINCLSSLGGDAETIVKNEHGKENIVDTDAIAMDQKDNQKAIDIGTNAKDELDKQKAGVADTDVKDEHNDTDSGDDNDPIIEDLNKVDISTLKEIYRESQKNKDCDLLTDETVYFSYMAKKASGRREEVTLAINNTIVPTVTLTRLLNDMYPDYENEIFVNPRLGCYNADDPELIRNIKGSLLRPGSGKLNIEDLDKNINGEVGQPVEVDNLVFGGKLKHGFFLEAGAWDCEKQSDSLYFEINHGWTGLLVEPIPQLVGMCKETNRNITLLKTCLSTDTKPQIVDFDPMGVWREGDIIKSMGGIVTEDRTSTVKMQCMPLYSILLSIGNPTINYFSLDIEGAEFAVLKTVPWEKVDIQVLSVETHMLGMMFPGTREDLIEYMDSVGFTHIKNGHTGTNAGRQALGTTDDMFVKKGVPLLGLRNEL